MALLKINGRCNIKGDVYLSGSKNSSLPIIASTLLFDGKIVLDNVPDILDIKRMLNILSYLKIEYEVIKNRLVIEAKQIDKLDVLVDDVTKFRASYYLMGALLGRYHYVKIKYPGGCNIGDRPINYHLDAFCKLGASINYEEDYIIISAKAIKGCKIVLPKMSVGATINIILASIYASGEVKIINPSFEPEVIDLINFLKKSGANIFVSDIIVINGKNIISKSFSYHIMYDRIEAGTFIALGLIKGPIMIYNADYKVLKEVLYTLLKANANIDILDNGILVSPSKLDYMDIKTDYYPGFPTDLEQIFSPILAIFGGNITENIFSNRFNNLIELQKMNANINIRGNSANFSKSELVGTCVKGSDLRGTTSLLIAGLIAKGETILDGYDYILRGYENIIEKLKRLGAMIDIIDENDM